MYVSYIREPYSELNKRIIPIFMDELSLSGLFSSRCLGANSKLDTEVKQLTAQKVALEVKRFFFSLSIEFLCLSVL